MPKRTILKEKITMEDLAQGAGKVVQQRAGQQYSLGKVDLPYTVLSEEALKELDVTVFTKAKLDGLTYSYSPTDNSGIVPNSGLGSWLLSPLKASDVALSGGATLEEFSVGVQSGYRGEWTPSTDVQTGGIYGYQGSEWRSLTGADVEPVEGNDWRKHIDQKDVTIGQEELIDGEVFPKKGDLVVGMTVPIGTTHLRVDGAIYAMSPLAGGLVSILTATGATIGGVKVKFGLQEDAVASLITAEKSLSRFTAVGDEVQAGEFQVATSSGIKGIFPEVKTTGLISSIDENSLSVGGHDYTLVPLVNSKTKVMHSRLFGFKCDGSDESVLMQKFRDFAANNTEYELVFDAGVYTCSVFPNFSIQNLVVRGDGEVVFNNIGIGRTLIFDNPTGTTFNVSFFTRENRVFIVGDENTSDAVYIRSAHHSRIHANVRGCGGRIYLQEFGVCNDIDVVSSINQGAFTSNPNPAGMLITRRNVGEESSANLIDFPIIEGMRSQGIVLDYAINTICRGGTSEANLGANVECTENSRNNKFIGIDLEVSGTGQGYIDRGRFNSLIDSFNDAATTITSTALRACVTGGILDSINNSGTLTKIEDVNYGAVGGELVDNSTDATIYAVYDIESASFKTLNKRKGKINDTVKFQLGAWSAPASVPGFVKKVYQGIDTGIKVDDVVSIAVDAAYQDNFILTAKMTNIGEITVLFYQLSGVAQAPISSNANYTVRIN